MTYKRKQANREAKREARKEQLKELEQDKTDLEALLEEESQQNKKLVRENMKLQYCENALVSMNETLNSKKYE